MRKWSLVVVVVLVAAMPAFAQDRPVGFNFGGGWAFPAAGFGDAFNTGWNGSVGVTYNINPMLGIQGEYMYDRLGGPDRNIDVFATPFATASTSGLIESNHQMHTGTFNLVYSPYAVEGSSHPVGAYFLGGGGIYHRLIQLTTPSVGYTSVCDPYWLTCYPALVEVDRIIGDRSSNDFGINLGAGMTFGTDAKFYIETRWHYVWGPKVTTTTVGTSATGQPVDCTQGCSTNAQYFPLTFGVRW
jgi:outer membrane protein with beta-barrel domain